MLDEIDALRTERDAWRDYVIKYLRYTIPNFDNDDAICFYHDMKATYDDLIEKYGGDDD